jgi:ectoine hydroxylase-related dioxygenase (phytanoyl-CoA dioxygenase family)
MSAEPAADVSAALRESYLRDGMVYLGKLLDIDEVAEVRTRVDRYQQTILPAVPEDLRQRVAKYESDGATLRSCYALHQIEDYWRDLAYSSRLVGVVRDVAGIEPELYSLELRRKAPRSNSVVGLHQESAFHVPDPRPRANIWLALNDVVPDSGPVRFWLGYEGGLMPHTPSGLGFSCDTETATARSRSITVMTPPAGHATMHDGLTPHDSLPNVSEFERLALFFGYVAVE